MLSERKIYKKNNQGLTPAMKTLLISESSGDDEACEHTPFPRNNQDLDCVIAFEIRSYPVADAWFKFTILLPQYPEFEDYWCTEPGLSPSVRSSENARGRSKLCMCVSNVMFLPHVLVPLAYFSSIFSLRTSFPFLEAPCPLVRRLLLLVHSKTHVGV